MENGRIAIPSVDKGGLDGQRAGHFGHCDVFTLVDVEEGKIKEVSTIQNQEHVQGVGCAPAEPVGRRGCRWSHSTRTRDCTVGGVGPFGQGGGKGTGHRPPYRE